MNVRIDALYLHFPAWLRAVLDLFGTTLLAGFVGILTWRAWPLLLDTVDNWSRSITPLQTPLVYPQAFWVAGLSLFSLTLFLVILATAWALLCGDLAGVQRIAGVRTLDVEVEEETHGMIRPEPGDG